MKFEQKLPLRPDRNTTWIYCDESSQTGHQYLVLGALVHMQSHAEVETKLEKIKLAHRLMREVKWAKVPKKPGKYFNGYKALLDGFEQMPLRFKAFIVDTNRYPLAHQLYTQGSADLGYYKYFYQLLYSGIIRRNPKSNYRVCLDYRPKVAVGSVGILERCINGRAVMDEFPDMWGSGCCLIEEFDSKMSPCLQLADLLTGMVAARWNQKVKNPTKLELIKYLEDLLKADLTKGSSLYGNQKFNRWTFKSTRWGEK